MKEERRPHIFTIFHVFIYSTIYYGEVFLYDFLLDIVIIKNVMGRDIKELFVFYDHEYKMLVSAIAVEENGEIASLEQTNCTRTRFRSNIIFFMVLRK